MADKKKSITPYAIKMTLSSEQAHESLELLGRAIRSEASQLSFVALYRHAYNLVIQKHGKMLYDGIETIISENISNIGGCIVSTADQALLRNLYVRWSEHKVNFRMKDILMYMDQSYVTQNSLMSVYHMGLSVFANAVVTKVDMSRRVQRPILDLVSKERNGDVIERDIMKSVLCALVEVGTGTKKVYQDVFEAAFLRETQVFYGTEAMSFLSCSTCSSYLIHAENRLKEEQEKAHRYLDATTEKPLMELIEDCFFVQNSKYLLILTQGVCKCSLWTKTLQTSPVPSPSSPHFSSCATKCSKSSVSVSSET